MIRQNLKLLTGMIIGLSIHTSVMGQTKKEYKVIKKTLTSEVINVSADSLWAILRAFDKTAEWTSTLKYSKGYGESQFKGVNCNARVCESNIKGQHKIVEELTMFSDQEKELAYNLTEGAPKIIKHASNHWKVIDVTPNQSKVQMNVSMHLPKFASFFLGKIISMQMKKQLKIVHEELKTYAETGKVSEAKRRQIEELSKS